MSNESEVSSLEAVQSPSEMVTPRDKALFGHKLLISLLKEYTGVLKLYFGLETGAVVLFAKVLTDVRSPTPVLAALVASILLFGSSAIVSLKLLQGVVELRAKMLNAWGDTRKNWFEVLTADLKAWEEKTVKTGRVMDWLFRLAIIFASIFVVAVLFTR